MLWVSQLIHERHPMKLIKRWHYLNQIIDAQGTPDIKVLTGIRRCGKSKLLEAFRDHILETEPDSNIIHINFNLNEFEALKDYHALIDYVENAYDAHTQNYLMIDEVQLCEGFELAINGFHASERFDIYITGSNAFLLSNDLATLFTGRTLEIQVYPFSFQEFREYFQQPDIDIAFDEYVRQGGMAGSYVYKNEKQKYDYIASVFNTLIVRDIKQRHKIREVSLLDRIADFMIDNISNSMSAQTITDTLQSNGLSANRKTVSSYMKYLCNAFVFYPVRRFDIRGKKYLQSGEKYYLADHSFRYALLGTRNMDWGRIYENIIAIELLRRGYEVYAGYLYQKEIDFVAISRDEKLYIQVCDNLSSPETLEREIAPLLKIKDAYPKMIIARTKHETYSNEGVQIIDIARWLEGE